MAIEFSDQREAMLDQSIYCGFCRTQCPLGVKKTADCRVIRGYECPHFCDPINQEPAYSGSARRGWFHFPGRSGS